MATSAAVQTSGRAGMSGAEARLACRSGAIPGSTAGVADGYVQANLAVFPESLADDFRRFAARNPKACPVIGESRPGSRAIPDLGLDLDLATDVPAYRVWRDGAVVAERAEVADLWRDDLVAFAIGCSFSFEAAMAEAGLPLRHVEMGVRVPMYRTTIPCAPAGPFAGPMVVSMRPLTPAQAIRAVEITGRYPAVHGAPVHLARSDLIGIADLGKPDYGDPVRIGPDEIPVFWACGVTPQSVIAAARPAFAITHAPGCMLVTDRLNADFAVDLAPASAMA
ncbi:putative hydro-lyase [Methylobacterium sp. NEAU 140]|uniref:putative hydro-lyase n=1 Tax=Methylobacterium sp. NEAU 140 TaxID=3064945 RepID=UPI0027324BEB|nr:putative hydro-lyase [Methylobacterium sp. NEAU 140]MDP4024347.1 putative hydro-lyase [Methylobacterium sp. NEAU 140]